jgi:unsaturated rhamnogalacturonyl hydrolase
MSHSRSLERRIAAWFIASSFVLAAGFAQAPLHQTDKFNPPGMFVGDMPANPGPLATDLSNGTDRASVQAAMRKVADWQLSRAANRGNLDWTYATLYRGFLAASETLGDAKYSNFVMRIGKKARWNLGARVENADDEAVGQSYVRLSLRAQDPKIVEPMRKDFDAVMSVPEDNSKLLWWWADALFMAPTAWAQLSNATGDPRYRDYLDDQGWITS